MALKLDFDTKGKIKIIPYKDSSVSDMEREDYDKYLEDLDEEKLEIKGEPTRFVLRKILPYEATQNVLSQQVSFDKGKTKVNVGYILEELRCSLIDVENPPGIPEEDQIKFKKDNDQFASRELVNVLYQAGVAMDLWQARQNVAGTIGAGEDSKKS